MKWVSAFSDEADYEVSLRSCITQMERQDCVEPDLIFVYFRPSFFQYYLQIFTAVERVFPTAHIVCCGTSAMMSGLEELADGSCMSMMAANLPGVDVMITHVDLTKEPGADASPAEWYSYTGIDKQQNQHFIVLADPFSANLENVLKGMDYAYDATIVGGFSSGMEFKGDAILVTEGVCYNHGVLLISLSGAIDMIPIVAQGCRGIGDDLTITDCHEVVLDKVNNQSPMICLKEISEKLDDQDKDLLHKSLFIGVEMDSLSMDLNNREYLIRNIRGVNPESGALVVGEKLQHGQNIRFHLRDPKSSKEELLDRVERYKMKMSARKCKGIMIFSCLGRLSDFYGEESVDAGIASIVDDEAPLSGLFCSGEVGPVQGSTYIHGYTAVIAYFYEPVK